MNSAELPCLRLVVFTFHLSPRPCESTAGCGPPSMSSIVLCLLLSCFTFHLGLVHPLQDVALHQCLPLSSVCCFIFHLSPRLCSSTAGCSPLSMSSIVLCLLLSCFMWFPPSLFCRLAIFCIVVLLISSLSLVVTPCSVWSAYCPSFSLYVRPISTLFQCQ